MNYINIIVFCCATTLIPGPNNLILLQSGIKFGFMRNVPLVVGMSLGFSILVFCVAGFIGTLIKGNIFFEYGIKILGFCYFTYIAGHLLFANRSSSQETLPRLNFWMSGILQWVNPKAWVMALGVSATFMGQEESILESSLIISIIYFICSLPCLSAWVGLGRFIQRTVHNMSTLMWINRILAIVLFISLFTLLF